MQSLQVSQFAEQEKGFCGRRLGDLGAGKQGISLGEGMLVELKAPGLPHV